MQAFKSIQKSVNKMIAEENKKFILKKLEAYYEVVKFSEEIRAKEYAIFAFWLAKSQRRLDNLNRIVKNIN